MPEAIALSGQGFGLVLPEAIGEFQFTEPLAGPAEHRVVAGMGPVGASAIVQPGHVQPALITADALGPVGAPDAVDGQFLPVGADLQAIFVRKRDGLLDRQYSSVACRLIVMIPANPHIRCSGSDSGQRTAGDIQIGVVRRQAVGLQVKGFAALAQIIGHGFLPPAQQPPDPFQLQSFRHDQCLAVLQFGQMHADPGGRQRVVAPHGDMLASRHAPHPGLCRSGQFITRIVQGFDQAFDVGPGLRIGLFTQEIAQQPLLFVTDGG